jgi:outer membrane receptor protein involved in Fe transport
MSERLGLKRAPAAASRSVASATAIAFALLWGSGAQAQDATQREIATTTPAQANQPAEDAAAGAATSEIIVTGSRLARSTFSSPTPVTVLGAQDFERLAVTNVGAGVSELPAFRPSNNPTTNGFGSFNVGAQIVNLRGLGVSRNLILVDGRRFAPTTREGTVDLNFIPSILVARTEVVTGGASAAYGSDAIAGVVNIILDKRLDGVKAQIDQAISEQGDGRNLHGALAFGTAFAGDAGHFVIGGEYSDQKGIGSCLVRKWCVPGAVVTNLGFAANGLPNYVRANSGAGFFFNNAGVISTANNPAPGLAAVRALGGPGVGGITFAPNGAVLPRRSSTPAFGLTQIGGDVEATYKTSNIMAPVERYTAFAHADYEFSDSLSGFIEGSYGHVDGGTFQAAYFSAGIPIFADNPYIPTAVRSALTGSAAQPTGPASAERPAASAFGLGRILDDVARGYSRSKADTYRVTGGLNGKFSDAWSWDAYYQYGRTDRLQTVDNNLVVGDPSKPLTAPGTYAQANARFFMALDAVVNPANGQVTCRALLSPTAAVRTAAAGCVPINLFGAGNVTEAGKNYIYAQLREDIKLQQHVAAANVRGEFGGDLLGAGPLAIAAGGEYRVDKIDVAHDDLSNLFAYFQNFGSDYNGKSEVVEGYVEAELPLIKDASFTKALTINGAIRQTHYKITGFGSYLRTNTDTSFDATSWKVSLNWEPVSGLRLRGTQSRDIRAPNFADLFLASASSFTPVTNRFSSTPQAPPSIVNGGSPSLRPEKADTTTVGFVINPTGGFLSGFRFSVDGYRIKVNDYISSVPGGAQFIVDRCFAGVQESCALINNGSITTGQPITEIRNIAQNLDQILAKGVDFEADYRIPLGETDNSILLRMLATYADTLKSVSFGDVVDRAGQTGNSASLAAPEWVLNGSATFATPVFSFTVQGRYIDSGLYDAQRIGPDDGRYATNIINSISDNRVASRFYVNLFGSIHVGGEKDRGFDLFGSVNNLFDKAPPAAPETAFYTNPVYFDTIGRYYRIGARYKM